MLLPYCCSTLNWPKKQIWPDFFATASIQGFSLLYALYQTARDNPEISSSALLERWRDKKDFEILQKLMQRNIFGTDEKASQLIVFNDAIQRLTMKYRDERFEILETKLKQGGLSETELEEYKSLLTRWYLLNAKALKDVYLVRK